MKNRALVLLAALASILGMVALAPTASASAHRGKHALTYNYSYATYCSASFSMYTATGTVHACTKWIYRDQVGSPTTAHPYQCVLHNDTNKTIALTNIAYGTKGVGENRNILFNVDAPAGGVAIIDCNYWFPSWGYPYTGSGGPLYTNITSELVNYDLHVLTVYSDH